MTSFVRGLNINPLLKVSFIGPAGEGRGMISSSADRPIGRCVFGVSAFLQTAFLKPSKAAALASGFCHINDTG